MELQPYFLSKTVESFEARLQIWSEGSKPATALLEIPTPPRGGRWDQQVGHRYPRKCLHSHIFGLYRLTGMPSWLIKNFSKFQVMSARFNWRPLTKYRVWLYVIDEVCTSIPARSSEGDGNADLRYVQRGSSPSPFTTHFAIIWNFGT